MHCNVTFKSLLIKYFNLFICDKTAQHLFLESVLFCYPGAGGKEASLFTHEMFVMYHKLVKI